ncbi:polyserase-2-like [Anopheles nili]|uniref:polyserase-2-like n=1 Tax=Anopheles nili TaxID=185578 RepID=UPI00237B2FAE|nr:polyserase-2-like [Anopheles nili]
MEKVISASRGIPVLFTLLLMLLSRVCQHNAAASAFTCGIRRLAPMGLVTKGIQAQQGDWPWHVALFQRGKAVKALYKCGGSIISENFVLTAAHCIEHPDPEQYLLKAGLHYLNNDSDPDVVLYNVFEIILHPKYDNMKYYNDISLIRPDRVISFTTSTIFPICLWPAQKSTVIDILRTSGIAVGFGFDENHRTSEILQQASMQVIEKQRCIEQLPEHVRYLPQHVGKLCAIGTETGANVCSGDSGGGLFFAKDSVWYLRGIVSAAARKDLDNGKFSCNAALPATYTDVSEYVQWIEAHQKIVDQRNLLKLEECGVALHSDVANETLKPIFNQYPWNVLLEFRQNEKSPVHLVCSGVLVHPRYVLTVGHCLQGIHNSYNLKSVRLGEYNIRTLEDVNPDAPNATPTTTQSVDIERIIFHTSFHQPYYANNLALLKLKHNADTSKPNIMPICLPSMDDYKESFLTLSGWKRNKNVFPRMERSAMNLTSTTECREAYEKLGVRLPQSEDALCAIYDTQLMARCHNYASGSSLQYIKRVDKQPRYFLAGLLAFNFPFCRQNGSEMFVNLNDASEWIKKEIK